MQVTVLGASGSHPTADEPCAGLLVEADGYRIVLDMGPGTFMRLLAEVPIHAVDALMMSHGHADHVADLLAWYHTARHAREPRASVPLYTPAGVMERFAGFFSSEGLGLVFDHRVVAPGDTMRVGPVTGRFGAVVHPVAAVATRLEVGSRSIVYSGDTAFSDDLIELARGSDLFVCEATTARDAIEGVHCDAVDAGTMAAEAGVGHLVLTHVLAGEDPDEIRRLAGTVYDGPVDVARSGRRWSVG